MYSNLADLDTSSKSADIEKIYRDPNTAIIFNSLLKDLFKKQKEQTSSTTEQDSKKRQHPNSTSTEQESETSDSESSTITEGTSDTVSQQDLDKNNNLEDNGSGSPGLQ